MVDVPVEPENSAGQAVEIDFQPVGRRVRVPAGTTVLGAAREAGVSLSAVCGGKGTCGACRVRPASPEAVSGLTPGEEQRLGPEFVSKGYRLACRMTVRAATRIDIPPESLTAPQRAQVEGDILPIELAPAISVADVTVPPAAFDDLRGDWERFHDSLVAQGSVQREIQPGLPLLKGLSETLRQNGWQVRALLRQGEVFGVTPPGGPILGLAVDVGTTKLAAYLLNLADGRLLAAKGGMNPQIAYGEDVMARITFALQQSGGLETLRRNVIETLNEMTEELCRAVRQKTSGEGLDACAPDCIHDVVLVGNTAMHHLLLGLPVAQLGLSPYVAAVTSSLTLSAAELGLALAPGAMVYLPPNLAGFVGGDHTAMLLASGIHQKKGVVAGIDIGTNTEITLNVNGRMTCCSTASGPAFEGAHIRDGMRAADGAIERVSLENGRLLYQTIGGTPPVGICGSGILEAIARLRQVDIINGYGRISGDRPYIRQQKSGPEIVLAPAAETAHGRDILLTRKDISEIQLAKGAMRTGIELLLMHAGIEAGDIDEFIIAGAFGSYINPADAVTIGMFPDIPLERFHQIGNAAGAGARMALLSAECRRDAARIAASMEYLELTSQPEFQDTFVTAMLF